VNVDFFYVHPDHLGTPRVVTKTADNKKVWEWQSQPFGEGAANENPQNLTGAALTAGQFRYNLRFPGQVFDAETNKHYNYFRDYDPALGRYLESDPIGLKGGINTFGYVKVNPLRNTDPKGLATSCPDPCPPDKMRTYEVCINGVNDRAMEGISICYELQIGTPHFALCMVLVSTTRDAGLLLCRLRFPGCSDKHDAGFR
jgi:RHS repeat-associated protein